MITLSNRTYDVLKWVATILLPALATLYVALADTWGLPYAAQISATVMAVVLFLNAVLNIAAAQYKALNTKK